MRTSATITPTEVAAYTQWARERGVINDTGADGIANADVVLKYFTETWPNEINEQNLNLAWPQLQPHLKAYSKAQKDLAKVMNQEPAERVDAVARYLDGQGRAGQLVNDGSDESFTNFRLLLETLRGYEISATTILHAIDRIQNRLGPKLHYVQAPRRTEPISRHAKDDDKQPFLGKVNKSPLDYKRERDAAYAEKTPDTTIHTRGRQAAKDEAEMLRGSTHSESSQIQRVFIMGEHNEIDWQKTLQSRKELQRLLSNRRAVSSR